MKALSPRVPFPYIPKADRELPKEQQTTFMLQALGFLERAHIDDQRWQFSSEGTPQLMRGTQRVLALKCGLVGWTNFGDAAFAVAPGSIAGVSRPRPTDECLARIDLATQDELAEEILGASKLSDDDRKNS